MRYAWSLPAEHKLNNGISKYPLREVLYKYVPQELIERPKSGFGVPLADWFSGDLHEWVQDTMRSKSVSESGIFSASSIQTLLDDQFKFKKNRTQELWNILMFQTWSDAVAS